MKHLLVFLFILIPSICSAQRRWICISYPVLHNDYYQSEKFYHNYVVSNIVCPVNNKRGLTVKDVFNVMKNNVSLTAPTTRQDEVVNCNKVMLLVTETFDNAFFRLLNKGKDIIDWTYQKATAPIVTYVNEKGNSITNYTLEGHPLHDGKVTRTVVARGGNIIVITVGVGNNKSWEGWELNSCKTCMKYLWTNVDIRLRAEVQKKLDEPVDSLTTEQQDVKAAAIAFYKWYENVWEAPANITNLQQFNLVLNKASRPEEEDGYGCPCIVDWKGVERFFSYVKSSSSFVSNDYIKLSVVAMKRAEERMRKAKTRQEHLEAVEAFYLEGMFHLFPGNAGAPKFSRSGIYSDNAIWEIDIHSPTNATVNTTFSMPDGWATKTGAYRIKMLKENGHWKLAAPVQEGKISVSFNK